jgi:hypothetical protein
VWEDPRPADRILAEIHICLAAAPNRDRRPRGPVGTLVGGEELMIMLVIVMVCQVAGRGNVIRAL